MPFARYFSFCIVGVLLWVPTITAAGYYFGNIPFVKNHFEIVILSIIVISTLPILYKSLHSRFR